METKVILLLGPHSQHSVSSLMSNYMRTLPQVRNQQQQFPPYKYQSTYDITMMELLQSLVLQMDRMEATLSQFDTNDAAAIGMVVRQQEADNNHHLPPYPRYRSYVIVVDRWDSLQ